MAHRVIHRLSLTKNLLLAAVVALAIAAAPALLSQQQPGFEVATVKPNHTSDGGVYSSFNGVTISLTNVSLKRMIVFAYQIRDFQVTGGPNWIDSDRFDIEAKTTPDATIGQKLMMVQTLLNDRFQLALPRLVEQLRHASAAGHWNGYQSSFPQPLRQFRESSRAHRH
jgi:hypothetical protein